jgi:5,10-methylenetetrahydromethanopterin reductase
MSAMLQSTSAVPVGVWLFPDAPALELVESVVRADAAGFDEVWVADEGPMRDPAAVLAAAAPLTTRSRLGVGITSPVLRHPGALAATWSTIDELCGGRAILGLGLGGSLSLEPYGLGFERPVRLMRDAIRVAREALERRDGDHYRLMPHAAPARRVPIFIAAKGEQLNRLAAREADGVFLSGFRLADVGQAVEWARSTDRRVHVALYASVRFRADAPADPTALAGSPNVIAAGLHDLVREHRPDSIGMALVDGDSIDTMLAAAIETLAAYRGLSTRG